MWKQHLEQTGSQHLRKEDDMEKEVNNITSISHILDISPEQNAMLIKEQENIRKIKQRYQEHIDNLLKSKKGLFKESRNMEDSISTLKCILTSE